jgi:hypothetical protein
VKFQIPSAKFQTDLKSQIPKTAPPGTKKIPNKSQISDSKDSPVRNEADSLKFEI